ncbi:MAG: TIGR02646 family protein [Candidatus Competibacteraceae bacterium]|nr:TIGR02646 family protein [Candidatus Competibacteraceae bacterium]
MTTRAISEGAEHEPDDHYRHDEVRKALEKLFCSKCAYCERRLDEPEWDVEHYRPKGRIAECSEHPGYYWLCYRWDNLYLACKFCNQKRKDRPHWDAPRGGPAAGKFDQFPVHGSRAISPMDELEAELPYLLDPCDDEPSEYLRYGVGGDMHATTSQVHRLFGLATIRICNLNRYRLIEARKIKIQRMLDLMKLRRLAEETGKVGLVKGIQDLLNVERASESQFAGLARAILDDPEAYGAHTAAVFTVEV